MREFTGKITPLSEIDVEENIDQIIDVANKGLGSSAAPHRFVLVDISLLLGLYDVYKNAAQQTGEADGLNLCKKCHKPIPWGCHCEHPSPTRRSLGD